MPWPYTSYTSLKGSIQNAALIDIRLAHDAAEYIGTLEVPSQQL
jgi:hypothetical protein